MADCIADAGANPAKRQWGGAEVQPPEEEIPEAKRLRAADLILLDILEEVDSTDRPLASSAAGDLDTVLKSFQEEICAAAPPSSPPPPPPGGEEAMAASDSDDCAVQPDLSYLLEASDDELGLPPTIVPTSSSDEGEATAEGDLGEEVKPEAALFAPQIWGFDDEIPCYCDPLDLGLGQEDDENAAAAAAAGGALLDGGLFDYADVGPFGPSDFLDYSWRPESLPAV
ncbi:unnamed protein product [Spirodela intermedia]|uniref:Uncharacterized protein n=1 Tax=Spirodela intermedia TaxID=51605 RepID=A0A7I8KWD8_SPIIN|nr:unnamed protein product [Spirodela intermedia]